jgi:hypothetical protein
MIWPNNAPALSMTNNEFSDDIRSCQRPQPRTMLGCFSRYQAVCLPPMRAALVHLLVIFSYTSEDCSGVSLIPDGNKIVSEFDTLFANKQAWTLSVLHRNLAEITLSAPGLRAAESFCKTWYRPYISDLRNHLIRIVGRDLKAA